MDKYTIDSLCRILRTDAKLIHLAMKSLGIPRRLEMVDGQILISVTDDEINRVGDEINRRIDEQLKPLVVNSTENVLDIEAIADSFQVVEDSTDGNELDIETIADAFQVVR